MPAPSLRNTKKAPAPEASVPLDSGADATEARAAAACRAAAAGAWQWNLQTDTPAWSEAFCRLHRLDGAPAEEATFEGWIGALHPSDRPRLCEAARSVARGRRSVDLEYRVGQDEPARWVHLKGRVEHDEQGEPLCIAGLALEVSAPRQARYNALSTADHEQRRLQHALQDELGQQLTGILIKAQVLQGRLEREASAQAGYLERIVDLVAQAHTYTRDLARTLAPIVVRPDELTQALNQLAADTEKLFGVTCRCETEERPVPDTEDGTTRLYRIAEEAVEFAVKCAQAHFVLLELHAQGGQGILRVTADTSAKTDEGAAAFSERGLMTLRHYASAMGAMLSVYSAAGGKLVLACSFGV